MQGLGIGNFQASPVPPSQVRRLGLPTPNPGNPLAGSQGESPPAAMSDPTAAVRQFLFESFSRSVSRGPAGLGGNITSGRSLDFAPVSRVPKASSASREKEQAWRRAHQETLRALAGQWVVLEGDGLVAHGQDPASVVAQARARGVQVPYVFFVEALAQDVVTIGL